MTSRVVTAAAIAASVLTAHTAWNLRMLRVPPVARTEHTAGLGDDDGSRGRRAPAVSVLVPARDEAERIAPCIRSVLASTGVDLELIVCDDGSNDGTADVVRRAADGDPRLRVVTGAPLPAGWLGKPHACHQLAQLAAGEALVFVDADVRLATDGLQRTVALLDELDLVSPYPRQEADGWLPRLVQPLLQWSWLTFLPLRHAERSPRPSLTAANGQLLACRAAAYRAAGGHAAVRDEVVEDVELARTFKRHGARVAVVDGTQVASCRMYGSAAELRDGYAKSLWAAFGSPSGAAAAVGLLAWCYVVPAAALVRAAGRRRASEMLIPATGYLAGVAGRVLTARRTRGRPADALAHPLSVTALGWLTVLSFVRRRRGTATWKGRAVAGPQGTPHG
jgi:hypothetical protein